MSLTCKQMEEMVEQSGKTGSEMVTVVCGEVTYSIPGNKLKDKSQFFARALEVPMVEKKERKVIIKDIESGVFEKVVKFVVEGLYQFDVKTEACEALEAADRLDIEELKETVCDDIKDNLEIDNAKAVLSLAERFNAKQLFEAAFGFMQENNIKLEMKDVVENPSLALAFMEECRITLAAMKEALEEEGELVKYYRKYGGDGRFDYDEDSFDYDEDSRFDSFEEEEEVEEEEEEEEEGEAEEEGEVEEVLEGVDHQQEVEEGVEHQQEVFTSVEGEEDESEKSDEGQSGMKELQLD